MTSEPQAMDAQALALVDEGNARLGAGQLAMALACYDRAIGLEPGFAQAYGNRAVALARRGEYVAALASCEQALALNPQDPLGWNNRGNLLQIRLDLAAAIESYDRATALEPDFADAHWNKANALLLGGDFERGLPLYEWRWKRPNFTSPRRDFSQPVWLGQASLTGKTILLHSEQGLGDTLQFCRYVPMVAALGAWVILEVQPSVRELLSSLDGVGHCIATGTPLPAFDYHCPLLSLPLAFGTREATIPAGARYLASDHHKRAYWTSRLGQRTRPLVGIVWSGRPGHAHDHQRTISLERMLQWLPDLYDYVSLQKDVRDSDLPALRASKRVTHFGDQLKDFSDTAALCECVDWVIGVDTSVAHLAGALGKRTWILLPHSPDWRWQLNRTDSPWYPSCTLYRQNQPGDWSEVLSRVAMDSTRHWLSSRPCPVCKGATGVLGAVDFHKSCEELRGNAFEPSGIAVHYCRCDHCGFCFAPEIGAWTHQEFAQRIYNDDYPLVDPDARDKRPRANAALLHRIFGTCVHPIKHLDYGGGAGLLSRLLGQYGWDSTSCDPFADSHAEPMVAPVEAQKYELITAFEVFEHVPDPDQMMKELTAFLAPGGIILLSTQLSDGQIQVGAPLTWWYASPRNGHISLYSHRSLGLLAKRHGFRVMDIADGLYALCTVLPAWAQCLVSGDLKSV